MSLSQTSIDYYERACDVETVPQLDANLNKSLRRRLGNVSKSTLDAFVANMCSLLGNSVDNTDALAMQLKTVCFEHVFSKEDRDNDQDFVWGDAKPCLRTVPDPFACLDKSNDSWISRKQCWRLVLRKLANCTNDIDTQKLLYSDDSYAFLKDIESVVKASLDYCSDKTFHRTMNHMGLLYQACGYHAEQQLYYRAMMIHEPSEQSTEPANVLTAEQVSKLQLLTQKLHGDACIGNIPSCIDYLLCASVYGCPDETYMAVRRDWVNVTFTPTDSSQQSHIAITDGSVMLNIRNANKLKNNLDINLSERAPTLAAFLLEWKAVAIKQGGGYVLFSKGDCITAQTYSMRLQRLFKKHETFLGFAIPKGCNGVNGSRHGVKRARYGPPPCQNEIDDAAQANHSLAQAVQY